MIPILTADQIRQADAYTISNEPISSINLMERAARAFVSRFTALAPSGKEIVIYCGIGNNGGDGLAIGRMLLQMGYRVLIYHVGNRHKASKDFQINYERLEKLITIQEVRSESDLNEHFSDQLIVDGLFGSGLSRPIEGIYAKVIQVINSSESTVFAIDIPSGMFADKVVSIGGAVVEADFTLTFQVPKLVFMQPQFARFVGNWEVLDIELDQSFIHSLETSFHLSEEQDLVIPQKNVFDHKGSNGRVLLVTGSRGKMGAAVLAARAALRAGCGLLYVHTPLCGLNILQIAVPEAMVQVDEHTETITAVDINTQFDAIGIGPGIGINELTQKALGELIEKATSPMVIDADGLNILAARQELLNRLPAGSLLTPHPGEFKRLVGEWKDDFEKLRMLSQFALEYEVNVVLKGAFSAVCDQKGHIFFNPTGNPGMATGGSGDVLTGIITALLGQGLNPLDALRTGVYLHGLAGDLAREDVGQVSMIASDITDHLALAFQKIQLNRD